MLGNSTILFVDDEPFVLDALKRVFQDQGYTLLFANSALEAINHMEQRGVHLIVSDFRMPKMDGCELFQIVSERWPDTVRIILSGYADIKAVVSAINEGQIYKFVSKPWNNVELCEIVKSGLEKYRQLAEIRTLAEVVAAQNDMLLSNHIKSISRLSKRHIEIEERADLAEAYQIAFRMNVNPLLIFRDGILLDANQAARNLMAKYKVDSGALSDHPLIRELAMQIISLDTSAVFENVSVPVHLASGPVVEAELFVQCDTTQRLNIVAHIHVST